MFVTVPERYEASITTLENNKDLTKITLAELIHALHSQEQLRLMRQEGFVEGVLQAQVDWKNKKNPSKPITYSNVRKIFRRACIVARDIHHSNVENDHMLSATSVANLDMKL